MREEALAMLCICGWEGRNACWRRFGIIVVRLVAALHTRMSKRQSGQSPGLVARGASETAGCDHPGPARRARLRGTRPIST